MDARPKLASRSWKLPYERQQRLQAACVSRSQPSNISSCTRNFTALRTIIATRTAARSFITQGLASDLRLILEHAVRGNVDAHRRARTKRGARPRNHCTSTSSASVIFKAFRRELASGKACVLFELAVRGFVVKHIGQHRLTAARTQH